jgi:DNA-binding CsgD family transcriptional regulator
VEKQRRDAMRKLEVENVASLVRVCLNLGLFNDPNL